MASNLLKSRYGQLALFITFRICNWTVKSYSFLQYGLFWDEGLATRKERELNTARFKIRLDEFEVWLIIRQLIRSRSFERHSDFRTTTCPILKVNTDLCVVLRNLLRQIIEGNKSLIVTTFDVIKNGLLH